MVAGMESRVSPLTVQVQPAKDMPSGAGGVSGVVRGSPGSNKVQLLLMLRENLPIEPDPQAHRNTHKINASKNFFFKKLSFLLMEGTI